MFIIIAMEISSLSCNYTPLRSRTNIHILQRNERPIYLCDNVDCIEASGRWDYSLSIIRPLCMLLWKNKIHSNFYSMKKFISKSRCRCGWQVARGPLWHTCNAIKSKINEPAQPGEERRQSVPRGQVHISRLSGPFISSNWHILA